MPDEVPRLLPRPQSLAVRAARQLSPRIGAVVDQIAPYTAWWDEQNQRAARASGPLLAAVGDSTAIGIGASGPDHSYVAIVARQLEQRDGQHWRTVNLALSGTRVADAIERQLPALASLTPDLVVCCIGTNDLVWGAATNRLLSRLRRLVHDLPEAAVIGSLAGSSPRAGLANQALRRAAADRGLPTVDPWGEPTPPGRIRLAGDRFHPNDLGYRLMAIPFCRQLGLPEPAPSPGEDDRGAGQAPEVAPDR